MGFIDETVACVFQEFVEIGIILRGYQEAGQYPCVGCAVVVVMEQADGPSPGQYGQEFLQGARLEPLFITSFQIAVNTFSNFHVKFFQEIGIYRKLLGISTKFR